jgi:hypothetical protein
MLLGIMMTVNKKTEADALLHGWKGQPGIKLLDGKTVNLLRGTPTL